VAAPLVLLLTIGGSAGAQVGGGVGVAPSAPAVRDSLMSGRPLSPARAFIGSFLVPGYSQAVLQRPTAMVFFSGVEIVGWAMLRRSLIDLDRARKFARDSTVTAYQFDPLTGLLVRDPETGAPVVASRAGDLFTEALIPARKRHVEDWAAIIVFNHLLAGADALVASHLWDVPVQVGINSMPGGRVGVGGTIKW
jgi:hypothetical protein